MRATLRVLWVLLWTVVVAHAAVLAKVPVVVEVEETSCRDSNEVLLASVICSSETMYFDFKATGNTVQGLQREFTPGSSNQIALDVANCPGVLTAVTTLAEGDDCVVAPG